MKKLREWVVAVVIVLLAIAALIVTGGCARLPDPPVLVSSAEATVFDAAPPASRPYRDALVGACRYDWGLDGPCALFGAQVEQESGWNPDARSPYAGGLAQFTPATADWIDDAYPDLGPNQPYSPAWALRALVRYDKHLFDRASGATRCDRHSFALLGYNGGEGWVRRDQAKATLLGLDAQRYEGVEKVNAGRNAAAFAENRGYVPSILKRQPKYRAWGVMVCEERELR